MCEPCGGSSGVVLQGGQLYDRLEHIFTNIVGVACSLSTMPGRPRVWWASTTISIRCPWACIR